MSGIEDDTPLETILGPNIHEDVVLRKKSRIRNSPRGPILEVISEQSSTRFGTSPVIEQGDNVSRAKKQLIPQSIRIMYLRPFQNRGLNIRYFKDHVSGIFSEFEDEEEAIFRRSRSWYFVERLKLDKYTVSRKSRF